ncbi:MAG: cytoplasmic iron level regulating protein YaaA (DUF328/UPF0246 family) [Paracoccaceae bacterium]|jgi:cytoplasmic iron level regulating protein YaaA (DUF328/UPF0246 family)
MLTVISPAKKLNETGAHLPQDVSMTKPALQNEANHLAEIARTLSTADLRILMTISEPLAKLNKERFAKYDPKQAMFPAAFLFAGDTYTGLDPKSLGNDALHWAQGHLRILSGLYGLLRPLDAIAPYRLEMGSRLQSEKGPNLYSFWRDLLAAEINKAARVTGSKILVNCASQEYFSAIDLTALKLKVVTPVFLEERNGTSKIVSFWAKKARGAMARYICERHLTDINDLCDFSAGGYIFNGSKSTDKHFIFTRNP